VLGDTGTASIALEVIPVRAQGGGTCYLVLFQDTAGPAPHKPPALPVSEAEAASELRQLRQELSATREYMQSMIEQQDAANEELRSANEEVLSSNEELQSTNEELETAKEELQSANEELTTVNEQLQRRNQELDRANNDLNNLLSGTSIPVVMVGADRRVRWFNAPTTKVINLLPSDVGRPIGDLNFAGIVPDLEKVVAEVIDNVRGVEREVRDRDGHWHLMRVQPYRTAEHRIDGAVIVLVDIDLTRRAQDELRQQTVQLRQRVQLLDLSPDAIIIRDEQNRVTSWNRGAEKMYGWSAAEALGRPLEELLGGTPETWRELNARLDRDGTWEGELKQKRKDGNDFVVHSQEVINRGAKGGRTAVLAIQRDVTERQHLVEALQQADRRKDEFLALLAHELRNPLAPIRNAAEIMRIAEHDPKRVSKARDVLERQVGHLSRIVDDLIDVTRIVEKKIELRKERVALSSVVETALETCRSMVEECKHDLTVNVVPEALYIDADPVRISQVLVNLLQNAAKYTDPGGKIWLSATSERPTQVEIHVRDTGIGIRRELLPHIFDMFTQGGRAPEHGRGGLGVGLTLVRSLVEMHGGEAEARSDGPGKGSEFIVRLPRAKEPTTKLPLPRSPVEKSKIKPLRIVVVDDSEDQLESLGMLLQVLGHHVRLAHDGPEALRVTSEFKPDVALVDIGLPGMNGYEVAQRLRQGEHGRDMLIVAQTGWGQDTDRKRSQDAGFDYHLVKPVAVEALEGILRQAGGESQE
jgi:two-component system CheB/CheR fusion protein